MEEITYDINAVTGRLGNRIAILEVELAHRDVLVDAYLNKINDLEKKLNDKK